jgi:hypothetical protein
MNTLQNKEWRNEEVKLRNKIIEWKEKTRRRK